MSDTDVKGKSLRLERLRAQVGLMRVVNKGSYNRVEKERATFGPVLPFPLPELVLVVLAGRVVVASSGAARFLPASHRFYSAPAQLGNG